MTSNNNVKFIKIPNKPLELLTNISVKQKKIYQQKIALRTEILLLYRLNGNEKRKDLRYCSNY